MHHSYKTVMLIAICLIIIGLIILAVNLARSNFNLSSFNNAELVTNEYKITENFSSVLIECPSHDIVIKHADDGICRVVSVTYEQTEIKPTVKDGVLTASYSDKRPWYEHLVMISFNASSAPSVTLYLPDGEYDKLTASTTSGDITLSAGGESGFGTVELSSTSGDIGTTLLSAESLTAASTSGDINTSSVYADNISVTSTSGEIHADSCRAEGFINAGSTSGEVEIGICSASSLEAKTTSGDLEIKSSNVSSIRAKTTSGDIDISGTEATGNASFESTSGNITFAGFDAHEINVSTISGGVRGTLGSSKDFDVSTVSGRVDVPNSVYGAGPCSISTTSGNVNIKIPG